MLTETILPDWINRRGTIYWYDQYALNDHPAAFSRYDPDRIVDEICATGADIIALYAANQFGIAYYPSALWPQHPNLAGRDYFGELLERFQARGKKVIAYINWLDSKHADENVIPVGVADQSPYQEQPLVSWARPGENGGRVQALGGGQWREISLASPHRSEVLAITEEILTRYRPDAFHVDMIVNRVDVGPHSRPELERICGTTELTREVLKANWREVVLYRTGLSVAFLQELSAVVRKHGVICAHNGMAPIYTGATTGIDEGWLGSLDVYLSECFDAWCSPSTDLHSTSLSVRWQRAIGKPSWMLRTSTPPHHLHWPISSAQWEHHAAACNVNGCRVFGPCGVGAYPDTTSPKLLLERVRDAFEVYRRHDDLHLDAIPDSRVALVFSWATRRFVKPMLGEHEDIPNDWNAEYNGWGRFLIEDHIPFDVVIAEQILQGSDIASYELVILPETIHLSDATAAILEAYVANGGRLLATGATSLEDEKGFKRRDFALGELLGITSNGSRKHAFAFDPLEEEPGASDPAPASGTLQQVSAVGRALSASYAVDPVGSVGGFGINDVPPCSKQPWPVAVAHSNGDGHSLYVSFDVGGYFRAYGDDHIRTFMRNAVDRLLPRRQLVVEAPFTVEVTLWKQPSLGRTIIHLANRTGAAASAGDTRHLSQMISIWDVKITCDAPARHVNITTRDLEVTWKHEGDQLSFVINRLGAYGAILIEKNQPAPSA